MRGFLWPLAVAAWTVALALALSGRAWAAIAVGDITLSFGQICTLVAIGAAWGDMRAKVNGLRREMDEVKRRVDD